MNKRLNLFYFGVLCFSLLAINVKAQKQAANWPATNWSHSSKNCHHLLSTPAQCKWDFFDINGSVEGTVVAWEQAHKNERTIYCASVAILNTGKEMIRVLFLNNYSSYKPGEHIIITAAKEPANDVIVPLDREYYLSQEYKGAKPVCRINSYDDKLLKTTWGTTSGQSSGQQSTLK